VFRRALEREGYAITKLPIIAVEQAS
jgi:hypothetical protein